MIRTSGGKLEEKMVIQYFLLTLPPSYSPLLTYLDAIPDQDLTWQLVRNRVRQEYNRRKALNGGEEGKTENEKKKEEEVPKNVFQSTTDRNGNKRKFEGKCNICGKKGHIARFCRNCNNGSSNDRHFRGGFHKNKQQNGNHRNQPHQSRNHHYSNNYRNVNSNNSGWNGNQRRNWRPNGNNNWNNFRD